MAQFSSLYLCLLHPEAMFCTCLLAWFAYFGNIYILSLLWLHIGVLEGFHGRRCGCFYPANMGIGEWTALDPDWTPSLVIPPYFHLSFHTVAGMACRDSVNILGIVLGFWGPRV